MLYNYDTRLYWVVFTVLSLLASSIVTLIGYKIATMPGPPPPQSMRFEQDYPFGNHPKEFETSMRPDRDDELAQARMAMMGMASR